LIGLKVMYDTARLAGSLASRVDARAIKMSQQCLSHVRAFRIGGAQSRVSIAVRAGWMILCLVLATCGFVVTGAADESPAPAAGSSARARMHRTPVATLDSRVQLMAKELGLDTMQQSRLKSILLAQRAEVAKVWNDPSVPAPVRIGATQAISEKTADRIRAMLGPEQREKYIKQHERDTPVGAPGGDVQKWMKPDPG
jgi:hypothetical protein